MPPHLTSNRAFTLIELLVVIAIIGILSSVVLASLNSARNKAKDSAIKSDLAQIRTAAEVEYDTLGSYNNSGSPIATGVTGSGPFVYNCNLTALSNFTDTVFQNLSLQASLANIYSINGGKTYPIFCNVWPEGYAVVVTLMQLNTLGNNTYWCIDSTGQSRGTFAGDPPGPRAPGDPYQASHGGATAALDAGADLVCN
jgi:prepilin-type N-terminal cleavage/methylation domain-containing protein